MSSRATTGNGRVFTRALAVAALMVAGLMAGEPALAAGDHGTADEAVALVKKAKTFIAANGPDKAYAEIGRKDGPFVDRDLYVVVYDTKGVCLAHGANPKLVGKDLSDNQDVDGKLYIKERIDMAAQKASFWQDYKYVNPVTKKIEPKSMYCETATGTVVCAGIYK